MRNWLLFYGLPCLDGILPEKYFRNFSYLVNGVYLLLKDEITRQEIVIADYCLRNFYLYAEIFYGKEVSHCASMLFIFDISLVSSMKVNTTISS